MKKAFIVVAVLLVGVALGAGFGPAFQGQPIDIQAEESEPEQISIQYTVTKWDSSLSWLAWVFRDELSDVIDRNPHITNPDEIYPGDVIEFHPYSQSGSEMALVSWYGPKYHGGTMANGETFDMYDATVVAHKRLPFGTKVRVTNLDTDESIVVTVQDRGPYFGQRDFDLSYAAAEQVSLVNPGVKRMLIEIVSIPE